MSSRQEGREGILTWPLLSNVKCPCPILSPFLQLHSLVLLPGTARLLLMKSALTIAVLLFGAPNRTKLHQLLCNQDGPIWHGHCQITPDIGNACNSCATQFGW